MSEQDGGPAFGGRVEGSIELGGTVFPTKREVYGMTLRDYFAAKALTALLADPEYDAGSNPDVVARDSYQFADAMLEARKK